MTTFTLPWPPSGNTYYRNVQGRTLISKRGREYRVGVYAVPEVHRVRLGEARLAVTVTLCPPDKRRRDLDNHMKGLLDALTYAGVWKDDSQIDDLHIMRGPLVAGGAAVVTVREAGEIVTSDKVGQP